MREDGPVFVVGTAYSGSRLLSWGLAQHPELTHALETQWLVTLAGDLHALYRSSTAEPRTSRLVELTTDRARFYAAFGSAVHTLLVPAGATREASRRWVDCTPGHAAHVAGLIRLFPHARFIHVLRDVRTVVKALVRWPPADGRAWTEDAACQHWLHTTRAMLEAELAFGPATILRVRQADLVGDPERTLRACLQFLDEPFCSDCLRPFTGLDDGALLAALAAGDLQTTAPVREEAELLSDLLLHAPAPNPARIARLDEAFDRLQARPPLAARATASLVQRVQAAAHQALPPEAAVLVLSKGDEALLQLGTRRAAHFPQTAEGLYAGFHPATSAEAIAHLEALRQQGHEFLLIPAPYFWWLEHYQDFAEHLHRHARLVHYQDDTCAIFGLSQTPAGWAPSLQHVPAREPARPAQGPAARGRPRGGPTKRAQPGPARGALTRPARLAQKLWGGFAHEAAAALDALCHSATSPTSERIDAAWELARWQAVQGDYAATLQWLQDLATLDDTKRLARRHLLLAVDAHLRLGQLTAAQTLIALGVDRYGYDTDLCLLSANALLAAGRRDSAGATDAARLACLNRIYTTHGWYPLQTIDPHRPLALDNLTTAVPPAAHRPDGPKISVIMPAYNAAATIGYALAGVQDQTWRHLELLVVDDASTDDTRAIVAAIAARDDRVRLIRLDENAGPYVARNAGLAQATGDFVTVHDTDDWSPAQKLEAQLTHLLHHDVVGSMTYLARASHDLRFNGAWRPRDRLLEENISSLMLRTEVLRRELGGWDPVRVGADTELRLRIEAKYGKARLPRIHGEVPWTLALDNTSSLTRCLSTHVRTHYFGVRHEYRRAYTRWHRTAARDGDVRLDPDPRAPRRFPAPMPILPAGRPADCDLLLIADFALGGDAFLTPYHDLLAALRNGRQVAIFHWPRYDLALDRPLDERLATLLDTFKVRFVVADEPVQTRHLLLYDPRTFAVRLDRVPAIAFDRMSVIVTPGADAAADGDTPPFDPTRVRHHLEALFGSAGTWIPGSSAVRTLMTADSREDLRR